MIIDILHELRGVLSWIKMKRFLFLIEDILYFLPSLITLHAVIIFWIIDKV